jgi:hypothetical protein
VPRPSVSSVRPILKRLSSIFPHPSRPSSRLSMADVTLGSTQQCDAAEMGCRKLALESSYPWQQVRRCYWWRQGRLFAVSPTVQKVSNSSSILNPKMQRGASIALSKDHFRIACRDPPRCWHCGQSGHTSPGCPGRHFTKGVSTALRSPGPPNNQSYKLTNVPPC